LNVFAPDLAMKDPDPVGWTSDLTLALLLPAGYGAVASKDQINSLLNLTTMRIAVPGPL
jgi:hypothetical protein